MPKKVPITVPNKPTTEPTRINIRWISELLTPKDLKIPIPLSLSLTIIIILEIKLNAATNIIKNRIRNITFFSISKALNNSLCKLLNL